MSTLIASNRAASKFISGLRCAALVPSPIPQNISKIVPVTYTTSDIQTVDTMQSIATKCTRSGPFSSTIATKGVNVTSRRFAHTDVCFPNFDAYRRDSTKDRFVPTREKEDQRRALTPAIFYGVGGMMSLFVAKEVAQMVVFYKSMPADMRALASIEINLDEIPEGQTRTFEWRGKPIFVKHRTAEEIKREKSVKVNELRHPQTDDERVQKDEWSIVIGICTHLGCVPIAGAGDFGGYYCPCHGSHYDGSGRIRKGPAPLNLEIPEYSFNDNVVVVGSS